MTEPEPAANPQAQVTEEMVEAALARFYAGLPLADYPVSARDDMHAAIAAAAFALSRPAADRGQIVEGCGWLIERNNKWWGPNCSRWDWERAIAGCEPPLWTTDAGRAVRFARKEDAERLIRWEGWQGASATEHVWPALSPAPAQTEEWLPTHRHKNTSGLYRVLRRGSLERDMSPVTIYENVEGHVFVRPTDEFEDGRFEPFAALEAQSQLLAEAREALEKIAGQREYEPDDFQAAAKYRPDEGLWTTDEYLADAVLAKLKAASGEG